MLIGGSLLAAACQDLLEVETPDIVLPDVLDTPAGLEAQRRGAYGDFVVAFSGAADGGGPGVDGHIAASGLLADELKSSSTQFDRTQLDARHALDRNEVPRLYYANLQRARRAAESAAAAYAAADDAPNGELAQAEANALAGFTYVFFAEDFCAGVPFSAMAPDGSNIEFGTPTATDDVFALAIARFDEAITHAVAAGEADLESLARVGKARALLGQGRYADAADAVAGVPTDFSYTIKYSANTDRQVNEVFNEINIQQRLTAVSAEGGNGIPFFERHDAGDPRVPYARDPDGAAFDASVEMFFQEKYGDRESAIPLADGVEARLIEAEAALAAEQATTFAAIHDALRARVGLDSVSVSGMTQDQRVSYHFEERALWLWLTGHRLGDLRRLVRHYGRDAESVFPTGGYSRPQYVEYGTAVSLQVPFEERNNPNFTGCTDLDA